MSLLESHDRTQNLEEVALERREETTGREECQNDELSRASLLTSKTSKNSLYPGKPPIGGAP